LATGQNLPETQVRLYWDALNGVSGFNVYRNYTPYGDFTKLNVSLIQSTSFLDSNVPIIIDTDPYYSVTSVNLLGESPPSNPITYENLPAFDVSPFGDMNMTFTAPQTKISTVTIESRSGMYPTNIQQKFFFEEIRRRNMWLLEQDGGDFWLFKRQQKEINANTEEDYGRADTVTYFNPIKIRVRYYNMAALKELATYGLRKQRVPRSWTIWTPRLHDRDILIDRENRRFEILNVTPYFQRDLITHQDFEMNELERTDLAYKHPQLIAPDLLAPYLQGGAC
jgi:hypothetical protein